MKITIEMGPGFNELLAALNKTAAEISGACEKGLQDAVTLAAGNVVERHISGQELKHRSGHLAEHVGGWLENPNLGVVGVPQGTSVQHYAWLLGDETMTITPQKSRLLAIPIGENLTASGVPRFSSPRQVQDGFFVRSGGKLFFGIRRGKTKRAKFRPLFVLVPSVTIKASNALFNGVVESLDRMGEAIQRRVDDLVGGLN